jgi:hypothetical protein
VIADEVTQVGHRRPGSSDTLKPLVPERESLLVPPEWDALDAAWKMRRGEKTNAGE